MIASLLTVALAVSGTPSTAAAKPAAHPASHSAAAAKPAVKPTADEAALKALDDAFMAAFNKKDVDGVMAYYADDAVVMDPGPALLHHGKDEIRKSFVEMFGQPSPMQLTLHDATYRVSGNLGYVFGLWTMNLNDLAGKPTVVQGRACSIFQKRGGKWVAVVDHASVPMPPAPAPAATAAK